MRFPSLLAVLVFLFFLGCVASPASFSLKTPEVAGVAPADGTKGVAQNPQLEICFDTPMNPATVSTDGVTLARTDGHSATRVGLIDGGVNGSNTCFLFVPQAPLAPSSHYTLTLKNSLLGADGIALGDSKSDDVYTATFATAGAPATGVLLLPSDGMLQAPLDLAQVVVGFDAPVALRGDGGPLAPLPGGGPSTLSADGRLAISPFGGATQGTPVPVQLGEVVDASGGVPNTDNLWFQMGSCAEGSAPNLGEGLVEARDIDGWLQFLADRPGLCGASVDDPGSADAGAPRSNAAQCNAPYDPCDPGDSCTCTVALVGLGAGDTISVTPQLLGYDGQTGTAAATTFQTTAAMPRVVINEVFPGEKTVGFVELQNRSGGAIDLTGLQLTDCGLSLGCTSPKGTALTFGPVGGVGTATVEADGYVLLVDPTFDAASVPEGTVLLAPLNAASMLHVSTTGMQSLGIFLPGAAAVVSMYDGSVLPVEGVSIERVDPSETEAVTGNWEISGTLGGTPGACNSVTGGEECDP